MIERDYWRSLEERAAASANPSETFAAPRSQAADAPQLALLEPVGRRDMLKYAGATMAMAGLAACSVQPTELIHAYAKNPEALLPGKAIYFATSMPWPSGALPLLAESHMGRPTKVEGNPEHPASLGATDAFAQASVLTLYDPDRSQVVKRNGRISTWQVFIDHLGPVMEAYKASRGKGLRVLTETVTSPTLAALLTRLTSELPEAVWHQYEPLHRDHSRQGALLAFGKDLRASIDFDQADLILSIESDFLASGPASVPQARAFSRRRRTQQRQHTPNRLYVVESSPSSTGASSDHRLALAPAEIEHFVRALAKAVGIETGLGAFQPVSTDWLNQLVGDLRQRGGRSAVVAGESLSPAAHALVHAINAKLGALGKGIKLFEPVELAPVDQTASLRALVDEIARPAPNEAPSVETLLILGANPVYNAPADFDFRSRLALVPQVIHVGLYEDETALASHWHIPEAHYLEAWGDALAGDGSVVAVQPLILPLYGGKSLIEVVAALLGQAAAQGRDLVRETWKVALGEQDFESKWRRAVHDGFVAGSARSAESANLRDGLRAPDAPALVELELALRADTSVYDGRFANNAWMQELPRPLTKIVWENALHVAPSYAAAHGLKNGDKVRVNAGGRSIEALVWVQPGQAARCATLHLGYGRTAAGQVGNGVGCNAYALRTASAPWNLGAVVLESLGEQALVASAQEHHGMEGRDLIRELSSADYAAGKTGAPAHAIPHEGTSFYKDFAYDGAAWGMLIDLSSCTGCNACVVACQSENNIAVVGKEEVAKGRELHWLRIDRYFAGSQDAPEVRFQPLTCMHCEKAPCEVVCPVGATVHGPEGLNDMVYNRCIGTRYCSNNCPYKVRRFNFLLYSDFETESLKLQRNPDVTVRSRGVMEKCTYCVQRINEARLVAKKDNRKVRDGEIVTACQQVCPSEAIVFGDINDPASKIAQRRSEQHNYALLEELNTRPRTTYLARVHNKNAAMPERVEKSAGTHHE